MRELKFEDAGALQALEKLKLLFASVPWAKSALQCLNDHGLALIASEPEGFAAPGTSDVVMLTYPTCGLVEFMSALEVGAHQGDFLDFFTWLGGIFGHGLAPDNPENAPYRASLSSI